MKILFFGDSITDMGRNRDLMGQAFGYGVGYVNNVASTLKYENPEKYEIVNRGISGNRVVDLYARVKADVWNHTPDVISILIGVNDVWHEIHGGNGVELNRFEKVYRMLIEDTKEQLPNVKFILIRQGCCQGRRIFPLLQKRENVYFTIERMLDNLQIEEIEEKCGCDKLLFGSGYPERPHAGALGLVMYADITAENREKILSKNWEGMQK